MMWEVVSYGERPYWEMTNQDVSMELCPLKFEMKCLALCVRRLIIVFISEHDSCFKKKYFAYPLIYFVVKLSFMQKLKMS